MFLGSVFRVEGVKFGGVGPGFRAPSFGVWVEVGDTLEVCVHGEVWQERDNRLRALRPVKFSTIWAAEVPGVTVSMAPMFQRLQRHPDYPANTLHQTAEGPLGVLGGLKFLMSEVPLYTQPTPRSQGIGIRVQA